jgi:flavin-binding protein dodecin
MQRSSDVSYAIEFVGASAQSWELAARSALDMAANTMRELGGDDAGAAGSPRTYRVRLQVLCDSDPGVSCVLRGI